LGHRPAGLILEVRIEVIFMNSAAETPSFMMDHMVIRLGKYLRIAGYDAEWDTGLRTHDLIQRANAGGRIFVTRNTRLADQYPPVRQPVVLADTDPVKQFHVLVNACRLDPEKTLFSRCIRCNVELAALEDKREVAARVHPNVLARNERFFQCPHCGTVFWHGSHVVNSCRKLGLALPGT
jgi:uncharacterized protein